MRVPSAKFTKFPLNNREFANYIKQRLEEDENYISRHMMMNTKDANQAPYVRKLVGETKQIFDLKGPWVGRVAPWGWLEDGEMYLVLNSQGSAYVITAHPRRQNEPEEYKNSIWYVTIADPMRSKGNSRVVGWDNWSSSQMWVRQAIKLEASSISFINWMEDNPLEVKG